MKRCSRCILPENYPNITFNDKGVCNYCVDNQNKISKSYLKKLESDLEKTLRRYKNKGEYDCLIGLSGGKDSTYLLYLLVKKYKLNVLAVTIDNGFLSEVVYNNIKKTVNVLSVDHIFFKPDENIYKKIFSYVFTNFFDRDLSKTSDFLVCHKCFRVLICSLIRIAIDKDVPIIVLAASPDQERDFGFYKFPKSKISQKFFVPKEFKNILNDKEINYFWNPKFKNVKKIPSILFPFHVLDYDSDKITKKVVDIGLIDKGKANSWVTNCYITKLMVYLDMRVLGYFAWINNICRDIRNGKINRLKALSILKIMSWKTKLGIFERKEINFVLKKLNLSLKDILK